MLAGHLEQLQSEPHVQDSPQLQPLAHAVQPPPDFCAAGLTQVLQVQSSPQEQLSPQLQPLAHSLQDMLKVVLQAQKRLGFTVLFWENQAQLRHRGTRQG